MFSKQLPGLRTALGIALSVWLVTAAVGCEPNPTLRKQGMSALRRGSVRWAENRFEKALRQDPTDWKSLYYLGLVRLEQQLPLQAELLLGQSLILREDHSESADILDALAESLYRQGPGGTTKLHALLARTTKNKGGSRDFLRQGAYLTKIGDMDGAKMAYHKAAYFAPPGDTAPLVALADFSNLIGDHDAAVDALRQAYSVDPDNQHVAERLREHGLVPGPTVALPANTEPRP